MRRLIDWYVNLRNEKGATMVEYALMVALVAVVALVGVRALGVSVLAEFNKIATAITGP